ncbi:MAG: cobalt-precorrin-7 (C(5))-methyltransferase [Candidatus Melainabacteria bacterium]|nr:MAG: cobalt-precorrin-7 (C(5))-methyltransferase [Candidatus Melainabacteria bacterium]
MIICVGIGPGDPRYLTELASTHLRSADLVAGFETVVNLVRPILSNDTRIVSMGYKDQVEKLKVVSQAHHAGERCVVAFMGDPHFSGFQFLERVEAACGHQVETIPGISSVQILASRAKVCFDETTCLTFHRRGDLEPFKRHLLNAIKDGRNAIVLPRPWDFMPKDIVDFLLKYGIAGDHPVEVWENLTIDEATWYGKLADCTLDFSDMSIMLIRTKTPMASQIIEEPVK